MHRHTSSSQHAPLKRMHIRILLVCFCVCVLAVGWTYSVFGRETKWDGEGRYTLVWIQHIQDDTKAYDISLFTLEPRSKRGLYIRLPRHMLVDVPYGYQTYPIGSVYGLGELDAQRGGDLLVQKSIERTMGIFIDGTIVTHHNLLAAAVIASHDDLTRIKQTYATWRGLFRLLWERSTLSQQVETTIPLRTWYQLWRATQQMRSDQISYIDLEDTSILSEQKFPDGTIGKSYDGHVFDLRLAGVFEDERIRKEFLSVEVVNASGRDGLASEMSKKMEKIGAYVIEKSTSKHIRSLSCLVSVSSDVSSEASPLIFFLRRHIGCSISYEKEDMPIQSDVRILLGEGFDPS